MCTSECGSGCFKVFSWIFCCFYSQNMNGINNKSNGVVLVYTTTSFTLTPEVRIDLLTFMQIVNNFTLKPYSKLRLFRNLYVNRNVCQISMRFEEANCAWNNWFTEVQLRRFGRSSCKSRYIDSTTPTPLPLLFIPYKFSVRVTIKFRITKEKEKEEDTIKRPQQNV